MLVAQGAINVCSNKVMVLLSHVAVVWNILGTLTLIILLPSIAKEHQTAKFVFTHFARDSPAYAVSDWYVKLKAVSAITTYLFNPALELADLIESGATS